MTTGLIGTPFTKIISGVFGSVTGTEDVASTPGSITVTSGDTATSQIFWPSVLGTYTATNDFLISLNGGTAVASVEVTAEDSDYLQMSKVNITADVDSVISTTGYSATFSVTIAVDMSVTIMDGEAVTMDGESVTMGGGA